MENWSFSAYNKENWISKLKKELNDRFNRTIYINPFDKIEIDLTNLNSTLTFNHNSVDQSYLNGFKIMVYDEQHANKVALELLSFGVQTLWFDIKKTALDKDILFKNINLEYITTFIETTTELEKWQNYVVKNELESIFIKGVLNTHFINAHEIREIGGSNIIQNAYALLELNEILSEFDFEESHTILLTTATSGDFLLDISNVLALRLIVNEMINKYNAKNVKVLIASTISHFNKNYSNHERNLVRLTVEALSSKLGNADFIINLPWQLQNKTEVNLKEAQDMINAVHILMNESSINTKGNLINGTVILDELCHQIIKNSWDIFLDLHKLNNKDWIKEIQNLIQLNKSMLIESFRKKELRLIGINMFEDNRPSKSIVSEEMKFINLKYFKFENIQYEN